MNLTPQIRRLTETISWSYQHQGPGDSKPNASEPAAWATLALWAHDQVQAAHRPAKWLADLQQPNGAVGIAQDQATPRWPTSLAMLAWQCPGSKQWQQTMSEHTDAALQWAIEDKGRTGPRTPQTGHDTTLPGWSWAADTHSWMEPTCFFVKALTQLGQSGHERVRIGLQMIVDRLLPEGGCNYGNTHVLGQKLLPHLQPTGIAMWALAGHPIQDPRIDASLDYLHRSIRPTTATASLSFSLMGLSAHDRATSEQVSWAEQRLTTKTDLSPYHTSLLLLALASPHSFLKTAKTPAAH